MFFFCSAPWLTICRRSDPKLDECLKTSINQIIKALRNGKSLNCLLCHRTNSHIALNERSSKNNSLYLSFKQPNNLVHLDANYYTEKTWNFKYIYYLSKQLMIMDEQKRASLFPPYINYQCCCWCFVVLYLYLSTFNAIVKFSSISYL